MILFQVPPAPENEQPKVTVLLEDAFASFTRCPMLSPLLPWGKVPPRADKHAHQDHQEGFHLTKLTTRMESIPSYSEPHRIKEKQCIDAKVALRYLRSKSDSDHRWHQVQNHIYKSLSPNFLIRIRMEDSESSSSSELEVWVSWNQLWVGCFLAQLCRSFQFSRCDESIGYRIIIYSDHCGLLNSVEMTVILLLYAANLFCTYVSVCFSWSLSLTGAMYLNSAVAFVIQECVKLSEFECPECPECQDKSPPGTIPPQAATGTLL